MFVVEIGQTGIVVGEKDNAGRIKFARGADGSDSESIGFAAADSNSVLSMNVASGDGTLTLKQIAMKDFV